MVLDSHTVGLRSPRRDGIYLQDRLTEVSRSNVGGSVMQTMRPCRQLFECSLRAKDDNSALSGMS
jgi:hypothetical protein